MLELDDGRDVASGTCDHCGAPQTRVTGFVLRDGAAHAAYFASCYHHEGHEVWIDAVFSPTWADDILDRYTFGCRVGAIEGQSEPAASMVDAASVRGDSPTFGRKLTREEALAHPHRDDFWALVDFILTTDPDVAVHMGYMQQPRHSVWTSLLTRFARSRRDRP